MRRHTLPLSSSLATGGLESSTKCAANQLFFLFTRPPSLLSSFIRPTMSLPSHVVSYPFILNLDPTKQVIMQVPIVEVPTRPLQLTSDILHQSGPCMMGEIVQS